MSRTKTTPFDHIAKTVGGSFVLYLYAAIYRFLKHLHQLSDVGGPDLPTLFKRYPFLSKYSVEMHQHMPEEVSWSEGANWWSEQIQLWEEGCQQHLPLRALIEDGGLSFDSCLAFMITGLVEEDSRFGTLFTELQGPLPHRRPTLELVGQIMVDEVRVGEHDPWVICRSLLTTGLVVAINKDAPRSEWLLRVPSLLWDTVRGEFEPNSIPWIVFHKYDPHQDKDELIIEQALRDHLTTLPALVQAGITHTVILRGQQGSNADDVIAAVAANLGKNLVSVEGEALENGEDAEAFGSFCTMTQSVPLINYDLAPGETVQLPALKGYSGLVSAFLGMEGGVSSQNSEKTVTLYLPAADAKLREAFWRKALNGHDIENFEEVVNRFHLSGHYIQKVADAAVTYAGMGGRKKLNSDDVRQAARMLNRQTLDTLADYLEPGGKWSLLVTTKSTESKLYELQKRCLFRERIINHLGPAFSNNANQGVRALFTGTSGTGKTLAARILAAELGMDLYRVDLAAIINKYIGETEKNLHQVLSRAEALDVVLLLDEGDALLGTRTDVKSANDRYANLETNYLLQRLENYQGIVVVTTNLGENIDKAFQRRMDIVVPFLPPQPEERMRIMEIHLPTDHHIEQVYLEQAALRCSLTGGQIRNAIYHATLLAFEECKTIDKYHLDEALRGEFHKTGGTFPLSNCSASGDDMDGGMGVLMDALCSQG